MVLIVIELVYANRTENLLEKLAADLDARRRNSHPLEPVEIVTPNRNMETWIRLNLSQISGIAANLRFRRLERFIGDLVSQSHPEQFTLVDLDYLTGAILAVLEEEAIIGLPELKPVRNYLLKEKDELVGSAFDINLAAYGADLRHLQLASRLAYLYQEYIFSRPEMINTWRDSQRQTNLPYSDAAEKDPLLAGTAAWQKSLWQFIFNSGGILESNPPERGGRWITLEQLIFDEQLIRHIDLKSLPPVYIFGVSYVARLFQMLFARLGEAIDLKIYTLNPCAEFWEDLETHRELFKRLNREKLTEGKKGKQVAIDDSADDPFGLLQADTPALRYWGRPGREHIRLLGELTDCDFHSAFTDPLRYGSGLLHILQQDMLMREPERTLADEEKTSGSKAGGLDGPKPLPPDKTIRLIAAPSVRREVEWVADEIWRLTGQQEGSDHSEKLRFSDIAVIVNSAEGDTYLPQIESVFSDCHNLPCSISDLPGSSDSSIFEAMALLLKLPFGRFSRAEMLTLMGHPALIGSMPDLAADDFVKLADRLNIIFGADHQDHSGTYIDEDVFNWDQGIKRLALGAFMTGDKSGDERIYESEAGRWLVEENWGTGSATAARFGLLARSLLANARYMRDRCLTLSEWSIYFISVIEQFLKTADNREEQDRLRLISTINDLVKYDFQRQVSGRTACELALRLIDKLGGSRGQYLTEGVVVSSFLPMRAIPFKVIFLLGLGEGLFPAAARRDALDLRAAKRRAGDVDPAERDRYMFLETLLCAREKLYLSYVHRDAQTGDPLQPSAVIQELLHILKNGYVGQEGLEALRSEPPLHRYDQSRAPLPSYSDEAKLEAHIRQIAVSWQSSVYAESRAAITASPDQLLQDMRSLVSPEAWDKLAKVLALPGEPPAAGVDNLKQFQAGSRQPDEEAKITIHLSTLRNFLECPMQGWAAAMLGLTGGEENSADLEEEDFEMKPHLETGLLRNIFTGAIARGFTPAYNYRREALKHRLQGSLPVGILGQVSEQKHLGIFAGWEELLSSVLPAHPAGNEAAPLLQQLRFGRSFDPGYEERVIEPLELKLLIPGEF